MKTLRGDSSPFSKVASVSIPTDVTLQSAQAVHAELLGSDLHCMTSAQVEEAIKPLREVADSLQGWLVRVESFLERAEAALQRLPLAPAPMVESAVGFVDEAGVELFGSFSPRVGSSSTPLVLPDFKGETSVEVVSPVLQIMPELHVLCGEPVSPLSMEQLKLGSLQASEVDLVSSPLPVEPCQAPDSLPLGVVERGVLDVAALPSSATIEQVMPVSDMTIEPLVLAPTPSSDALFAKELCDLLASVEVARPGLGRSIACLLTGTPIRGKQKKVGKGKSGAKGKASLAA
jgi:hypothetical protein